MMKILTIVISTVISFTSSANWVETNKGLYKILELEGAKIISVNSITKDSYKTLTTITTNSGLYRCYETVFMHDTYYLEKNSCYVLRAN